jgi:glycosyltransferase involved in cell wall biosynthesis
VKGLILAREIASNLVSVVIPTYNQKDYVRETFDSVLAQTYPNIEIIISDNGSNDGTAEIIEEYRSNYPEKVIAVSSSINTGLASNFNRGLSKARGEFIAWLDGDDVMFPERIHKQVELLKINEDAVGCCHDVEVFKSPSGQILGIFSELSNGKKGVKKGGVELWFDSTYLMLPTTFMFRSIRVPEKGFDERLNYANDLLFYIELFRSGKCVVIDEVLGRYRRHESNVTGDVSMRDGGIEETMVVMGIIEARYPDLIRLVRKRRIVLYLAAAIRHFRVGDIKGSRSYLGAAIIHGAVFRGIMMYLALIFFGSYIAKQTALIPYERSIIFTKLSKYIKC